MIERVWNWGELIVLQINRKKCALHDFIAGTVVVRFAKHAGSPATRATLFPSEGVCELREAKSNKDLVICHRSKA